MGNRIRTAVDKEHSPSAAAIASGLAGGREGCEDGIRRNVPVSLSSTAVSASGLGQPSLFKEFPEQGRGQLGLSVEVDPGDFAD